MAAVTDPMDALRQLQTALYAQVVRPQQCEIHRDLRVVFDQPAGIPRFTYLKEGEGKVQCISLFVLTPPVDGIPCFQIGYAVAEDLRGQGLATMIVRNGIEELHNGLTKNNRGAKLYIEAVVGVSNEPSNRLAKRLISDAPEPRVDEYTGEPVLRYLRLL